MKFSLVKGNALEIKCGALIIGVYKKKLTEEAEALDKASGGEVSKWIKEGDIQGCLGKVSVFRGFKGAKAERVIFVGLGKDCGEAEEYAKALEAGLTAARMAKDVVLTSLHWTGPYFEEITAEFSARIAATVFSKQKNYKTKEAECHTPKEIKICYEKTSDEFPKEHEAIERGMLNGVAIAKGLALAKELGDMPANLCTPTYMADQAMKLGSKLGIDVTVFDEKGLEKLKMGCFLGVAAGSKQPPRMIVMEYNGGSKKEAPIALVGKGLTFDSGGISLKPGKGMDEMKYDMSGAACMMATIATCAALKVKRNIVAVMGCTENMPSGSATKPGDILTSYSGKTVEVLNTDAEGRLVLCDLLSYAIDKFKPQAVIDAATLTGACVVALGNEVSGLFSNDYDLSDELVYCGDETMDPVWVMPLLKCYKKSLKSNFADLANISSTPGAGACTAAAFLNEFVGDTPWAHLDVAGTAWKSGSEKGSTGRPLPLLVKFLNN